MQGREREKNESIGNKRFTLDTSHRVYVMLRLLKQTSLVQTKCAHQNLLSFITVYLA